MVSKTVFKCWVCIEICKKEVRLDCNIQSVVFLAKNPTYHAKTKHIDVQYHFVRDMVEDKNVLLEKVDNVKNVADSLTKSISIENFSWCREYMGVDALNL